MKIRAKVTGEVIDVSDATATELIEAGIYEPVTDPETSTAIEPMMTKDAPVLKKKVR
jgi:hypothetical protein